MKTPSLGKARTAAAAAAAAAVVVVMLFFLMLCNPDSFGLEWHLKYILQAMMTTEMNMTTKPSNTC
jgi:hypothetical protein